MKGKTVLPALLSSLLLAPLIVAGAGAAPARAGTTAPGSAESGLPAACSGPGAHAFDFWIGDWHIDQHILRGDGTWLELPARTSVAPALDGCALVEHWHGQVMFFWDGMEEPESMSGLSVRAYDAETDRWTIHWMDTRTPRFGEPYVGGFTDGRGTFFREWETPEGKRRGRITFSDISRNAVTWELAVSSDGGKTFNSIWKMDMRRRKSGAD